MLETTVLHRKLYPVHTFLIGQLNGKLLYHAVHQWDLVNFTISILYTNVFNVVG